jgi:OPA family sugar phosphate sensor protein UhpC-like MFS transporter
MKNIIKWFATGTDAPRLADESQIDLVFKSRRWRLFLWLIIGYGFFYTCRLSLSVAKKPMLDDGVMSVAEMGIIGSLLFFVYAFGKFFNGFLADRANIRRFMSVALFLSAIANLAFGAANNFYMFAALWAFNGWFQSIGSAPSVVSLCQWFSNKERGARYGIWAGAHNIGEGLTFVGTALVVNALGWRWGFWAPGLACVIVALIMYLNLSDRPQTYGLPSVAEYKGDLSAQKSPTSSVGTMQLQVLKSPIVWVLGLSCSFMYMGRYAVNSWAIFYLQEGKGYELVQAASAMAAYPIFGLLGAVFSGFLSDKFFGARRSMPTLLYGILLVLSLCLFYYSPPGYLLVDTIALAAFGFAVGGLIVFLGGLIAVDLMPTGAAGAVKGVIGLFAYLGAAAQDLISGFLIEQSKSTVDGVDVYQFDNAFYFWIGASVASLLFALFAWNKSPSE